jgi:hypothetical protein
MTVNAKQMAEREVLLQRAAAVAAFKSRVQVAGMTRPKRSVEERTFLVRIGASMPFRETDEPLKDL